MFGRAHPRHAGRRPGARERALVLRRLHRIAPPVRLEPAAGARDVADATVGTHPTGGWVPRGRARRTPTDDDPEPEPVGTSRPVNPADTTLRQPGPTVRLAARFGVSPAHVLLVSIALVVALVLAGLAFAHARPHEAAVGLVAGPSPSAGTGNGLPTPVPAGPAAASTRASRTGLPPSATAPAAVLVVHVIGKVRHPGLVRLPPGARVMEAITAAGGPTAGADLSTVNLARLVADGEQLAIDVPSPAGGAASGTGTSPGAGSGAGSGTGTGSGGAAVVDLNNADLMALESLPGVGPVLAQRILDFRTENGRFTRIDELKNVKGIGAKTFADIEPHVVV